MTDFFQDKVEIMLSDIVTVTLAKNGSHPQTTLANFSLSNDSSVSSPKELIKKLKLLCTSGGHTKVGEYGKVAYILNGDKKVIINTYLRNLGIPQDRIRHIGAL